MLRVWSAEGRRTQTNICIAIALCVLVFGSGNLASGSSAAGQYSPHCDLLTFGKSSSAGSVGFCFGSKTDLSTGQKTQTVALTQDGGATWEKKPGAGLTFAPTSIVEQLVVSPLFDSDKTLFLHSDEGIFMSTDGGDTFTLANTIANPGRKRLEPFIEPLGATSLREHVVLAFANYEYSARIDPPLHMPLVASPDLAERFLLPNSYPEQSGFVVAHERDPTNFSWRKKLYRCQAGLTCTQLLHSFPSLTTFEDAWLIYDSSGSARVAIAVREPHSDGTLGAGPLRIWILDEQDRLVPWTPLNRLLGKVEKDSNRELQLRLATNDTRSGRIYAWLSYWAPNERPPVPGEQIFFSKDGGSSWKRKSFGNGEPSPRGKARIPWSSGPAGHHDDFSLLPDGTLIVRASTVVDRIPYEGPFCSVDGGRSFEMHC